MNPFAVDGIKKDVERHEITQARKAGKLLTAQKRTND